MKSIAWWLDIPMFSGTVRKSKHQNTWERGGNGKVKLADNSSLRKLMRAARREKITGWRMQSIRLAMKSAELV